MTLYAQVEDGSLAGVMQRPRRLKGNRPVTDEELMEEGIYPILDDPPGYDEQTHQLVRNPPEEWRVTDDGVEVTYTVAAKDLEDATQHYSAAIQNMLDTAAQSRRYDSGTTIATYVNSTNPAWAAEAQAFVAWRDAVWAYAYSELDKVMRGEREQPSVEAFLAELPEITWPDA